MNSLPVRVCTNNYDQADTKILMKLSEFSYPICDMTQIKMNLLGEKNKEIVEKKIEEIVDKLYNLFNDDGMSLKLKLVSDIILTSNDFSSNFSQEQYFNINSVFRTKKHLSKSEYEKYLKTSLEEVKIKDCGELNQENFYNIMSKTELATKLAHKILERKANKSSSSKENEEIIEYFKTTENSFPKSKENTYCYTKKIYNILEEINNKNNTDSMNNEQLYEEIEKIKSKASQIIDENVINNNYIIAEFNIGKEDINKKIRIINSYEEFCKNLRKNFYKDYNGVIEGEENEEDIKKNIEILINGEKISFSYYHIFKKEGKYQIKYNFKNSISNINYIFADCLFQNIIDISLNNINITNMNYMFMLCKLLENIKISCINTQEVTKMNYMIYGCASIKDINLSKSNTKNVLNKRQICQCLSYKNLNLSDFISLNANNMK